MNAIGATYIRQMMYIILSGILVITSWSVQAEKKQKKASLQPINIEITTHLGDQQIFLENDVVSFLLTHDKDAYITVIYRDASNNLYQVIPNHLHPENHYKAGLFISIPPQDATYRFKIVPPFGKEILWVFASDTGNIVLNGEYISTGIKKISLTLDKVMAIIKTSSHLLYGESKLAIETRKKQ